ncbi:MAG: flagellin [Motiliproteus sp.]
MAIDFNPSLSPNISKSLLQNTQQISSGKRINQASDDPAGFAVAVDISSRIRADSSSISNAINGTSLVQVADGGLQQINQGLFRLQELTIQSANGTLNSSNRAALQKQADQVLEQISQTISSTSFNGQNPLAQTSPTELQIGDSSDNNVVIQHVDLAKNFKDFGLDNFDISSPASIENSLNSLNQAVDFVASTAAEFGASKNRLDSTVENLRSSIQSQTEARSGIQDSDVAQAISELIKNRLLQQSLISLQAQANAQRGEVLKLLSA